VGFIPKVNINGVKIYYEVKGNGEPLCLLMGWGGSIEMWFHQVQLLSKNYELILIDNRGTGRSSKPNISYTMKMFVEDVKAVLDELHVSKLHLLGCSMGGMIAQHFALEYPNMLQSLILPKGKIENPISWFVLRLFTPVMFRDNLQLIFTGRYLNWLRSKDLKQEYKKLKGLIREIRKYPPTMTAMNNQFDAIYIHDTHDQLKNIKIPTLVMVGREDTLLSPENSKLLAKKISNAKLKVLDGGHAVWIESEMAFAKNVLKFLSKHSMLKT
jgi:3-oxoadipate enol-lactonase